MIAVTDKACLERRNFVGNSCILQKETWQIPASKRGWLGCQGPRISCSDYRTFDISINFQLLIANYDYVMWCVPNHSLALLSNIARREPRALLSGLLLVENRITQIKMPHRMLLENPISTHSHLGMVSSILNLNPYFFLSYCYYFGSLYSTSTLIILCCVVFNVHVAPLIRQAGGLSSYSLKPKFHMLQHFRIANFEKASLSVGNWSLQFFTRWSVDRRCDVTWHTRRSLCLDGSVCGHKRETNGIWNWRGIIWSIIFVVFICISTFQCR